MEVFELVKDNYYCISNGSLHNYYFKFEYGEDNKIFIYNLFISADTYSVNYFRSEFITTSWFLSFKNRYLVELKNIVDYLPIRNSDRLSYYRKQKLNYLLSI